MINLLLNRLIKCNDMLQLQQSNQSSSLSSSSLASSSSSKYVQNTVVKEHTCLLEKFQMQPIVQKPMKTRKIIIETTKLN